MAGEPVVGYYPEIREGGVYRLDKSTIKVDGKDHSTEGLDKITSETWEYGASLSAAPENPVPNFERGEAILLGRIPRGTTVVAIGKTLNWYGDHMHIDMVADYYRGELGKTSN